MNTTVTIRRTRCKECNARLSRETVAAEHLAQSVCSTECADPCEYDTGYAATCGYPCLNTGHNHWNGE